MKILPVRILPGLFGLCMVNAVASAQDTVFPPFGNVTGGTAYDVRAAADEQPRRLLVKHDPTLVRGLQIEWCGRDMTTGTGLSPQLGLNYSQQAVITSVVQLAPGEHVRRVDVWAISSFVTRIRIYTPSTEYTFGAAQVGDVRHDFIAPTGHQVVGFVGTTNSSTLFSLGVVTRPLLAADQRYGAGCSTARGVLSLRWRQAGMGMVLGQWPILECINAPAGSRGLFVYGFSDTSHLGVPLPYNLAPQGSPTCNLYTSIEHFVLSSPDAGGVLGHTIDTSTWPASVVGMNLFLQVAVINANNVLKTSDALRTVIGTR